MNRQPLYIGLGVTLTLFVVGTAFATAGLFTVYWMTSENDVIKYGLFLVCVDPANGSEKCETIVDFESSGSYMRHSVPDNTKFVACQICVVSGVVLGVSSIVSCIIFLVVNRKNNTRNKGPFIATMISAISSVICLAGGLLIFGVLIYEDVDIFFDLDISFTLTCFGAASILIGCFIFPLVTRHVLPSNRGVTATNHAGIVYTTNPQMIPTQFGQYVVPQQPGVYGGPQQPGFYGVPQQPGVYGGPQQPGVYGGPQQSGVQMGYGEPVNEKAL